MRQWRLLRIISGAVKNAADAHPEFGIDKKFARSVAKRAVGTLTAQWPEVLALPRGVASNRPDDSTASSGRASQISDGAQDGSLTKGRAHRGSSSQVAHRAGGSQLKKARLPTSVKRLRMRIGLMAGEARKAGNVERYEAIADVLRMIADKQKRCDERES